MGFIVGFNRDRDSYMVPLALAESGQLDKLVTDYYRGCHSLDAARLRHRHSDGISSRMVRTSSRALAAQAVWEVGRRVFPGLPFPSSLVDRSIGAEVRRAWRASQTSDLVIYSGYASAVFKEARDVRKVLFQFHPPPSLVRRELTRIGVKELSGRWAEPEVADFERKQSLYTEEIGLADHILCASSFTKRGLVEDGVPAEKVTVVPYGCPRPPEMSLQTDGTRAVKGAQFLFVGQGVERKGLRILLEAWPSVGLGSTLDLVCSRIDPVLGELAARCPGVRLHSSLSRDSLNRLFDSSDCLVLPSLVEGFGLVIGEALSRGCRVIATENTGLSDLALPPELGIVVRAGDVSGLGRAMSDVVNTQGVAGVDAATCRRHAGDRSWAWFRDGIRSALAGAVPGE
ncbi:MAG: glycosyltransferase family 4 protein [Coriobacteriales bacterium]|nr:glycosyltransferase family 4 protein [Coriobacteriales bacterium]